jgi:hypothetical protein|tara:strand:+ start:505 stop:798 length:294 start_codon:yes stop_codon:yes gene_type:complete
MTDNEDFTEEYLETITELIMDKLLLRMKNEIHAVSPMSVDELLRGYVPFKETDEEFFISELARLMTLLSLYEEKEEYMKAAIIKRKLEIIQNKLDKL